MKTLPYADDLYLIKNVYSEDFCKDLIAECERNNGWCSAEGDHYPGQEIRVKTLSEYFYSEILRGYEILKTAADGLWAPNQLFGLRDAFVCKYTMDSQRSLSLHNDHSLVSASVKLNEDYTGGQLSFPRQNITNSGTELGDMLIWPGQVTHPHESLNLTSGSKYSLTFWTRRSPWDN